VLVLKQSDEPEPLPDSSKEMIPARRFEPVAIFNRGQELPITTWRGSPDAIRPDDKAKVATS
jgi:hypothetical protein